MALPESILRRMAEGEIDDKEALRREIAQQTAAYLAAGGTITHVPFGVTGEPFRNFTKAELVDHQKHRTRRPPCDPA